MATKSKDIQSALKLISDGQSVRKACETVGISKTDFLRKVPSDQYARARDACADAQFDEMDSLERQCLEGEIAPDIFRATMDSRKWRLARMKPRVYGDKLQQEISGPNGGPVLVLIDGGDRPQM